MNPNSIAEYAWKVMDQKHVKFITNLGPTYCLSLHSPIPSAHLDDSRLPLLMALMEVIGCDLQVRGVRVRVL